MNTVIKSMKNMKSMIQNKMIKSVITLGLILVSSLSFSAQEFQGLCSYIRMEIKQELALERIGFLATLKVTNNEGDAVITDFSASLKFAVENDEGEMVEASDLFFVQPPELIGVSGVDGQGLIQPGETATVNWFIIPKISAGGESQAGINYEVDVDLAGSLYGSSIDPDLLAVIPDSILVKPEPQLEITYFQPRDVDGDNPFTLDTVESPIPFTLGVLVKNAGFGAANKVTIASEQPTIVEDLEDLLVVPQLIGSRINDEPTDYNSLTVNLGNIEPGSCAKGAWDMISSLSGEFTEFNARYTHASELGGEDTSVIKSLNAYFIVQEVLNDMPGRDGLTDFLATTNKSQTDLIPDTLFETDCNELPVNHLTQTQVSALIGNKATVTVEALVENWGFIRVTDPAQGKYPIESVVRSDGKILNAKNAWVNTRYAEPNNQKLNYLNIFDNVDLAQYQYEVTYKTVDSDVIAPVTNVYFRGEFEEQNDQYNILPETQIFFISEDQSPVAIYYAIDDEDFKPAYPFELAAGSYSLNFYAEDSYENEEVVNTVQINVIASVPNIMIVDQNVTQFIPASESLSIKDSSLNLIVNSNSVADGMVFTGKVYEGIYAKPVLMNTPISPSNQTDYQLNISGQFVDYYRYRINQGQWSLARDASQTLNLTDLSGSINLEIQGRHEFGLFENSSTVNVSWIIDQTAEEIKITNLETPTVFDFVNLNVESVEQYRWTVGANYFRAEQPISKVLSIDYLTNGEHQLSVVGAIGSQWQALENASSQTILIDQHYFSYLPEEALKFSQALVNDQDEYIFNWDGKFDDGKNAQAGWYSIVIEVEDALGQTNSVVSAVQVGDLLGQNILLADTHSQQKQVDANGDWVVWQDQREGVWNVFAKTLDMQIDQQLISSSFNQINPKTDGDYVVWQARQSDGNWDIEVFDLNTNQVIFQSDSSDINETKPSVYWPWVVYQTQPVSDPNAPQLIKAYHLIDQTSQLIMESTQDQFDPEVWQQKVVWQDFSDVGYGDIYFKDLISNEIKNLSADGFGQYHPSISGQWIVWSDNSAQQLDIYGYHLGMQEKFQLTDSAEDESRPNINGDWVVFEEDLSGESEINLRMMHLENFAKVQLSNHSSQKEKPVLSQENVFFTEITQNSSLVKYGTLPNLQAVVDDYNLVVVTAGMLDVVSTASELLTKWNEQSSVTSIRRYNQLSPDVLMDEITVSNILDPESNYVLSEGDSLWVKFDDNYILNLANFACGTHNLTVGLNVLADHCFADDTTALDIVKNIGVDNLQQIRMFEKKTGKWVMMSVINNQPFGDNFKITNNSVLFINVINPVESWKP
ncbi:hypothetical protein [Marinicellulosiphila megalodicopiae]|uniref:hypothetical protein n=1 Tax=Marinicellulosiphila megalodicopiae TaxID=2724896 RepID=UPI003BAF3C8F